MITKRFEDQLSWEQARIGKITGSKLKDLITKRGNGKKIGFYQLIADRLALPHDGEDVMDRGHRLESEAIGLLAAELGEPINTDLLMWIRDDNENIAISPDGVIDDKRAVEVKCLSSARHIEALVTQEVPDEYQDQATQYFIVNEELEHLYFVFYDPRLLTKQFFYFRLERAAYQERVDKYLQQEREMLAEVNEIVGRLSEL